MSHLVWLSLLMFQAPALADPGHALVPYTQRLRLIRSLAEGYPVRGWMPTRNPLRDWAGIYYFTEWQLRSGRDRLPLWEIVNREFTVKPYELGLALKQDPRSGCRRAESPLVCRSWLRLFRQSQAKPKSRKGLKALWRSHAFALADSLSKNKAELDAVRLPEEERKFWRGRTCLVFWLYKLNYPTTERFTRPLVEALEPPCSPLGAPHCRVEDLYPAARRKYVRLMIRRGEEADSLERCAARAIAGDMGEAPVELLKMISSAHGQGN